MIWSSSKNKNPVVLKDIWHNGGVTRVLSLKTTQNTQQKEQVYLRWNKEMVLSPQHKLWSCYCWVFLSTVKPWCERGSWKLICVSLDWEQDRDFPKGDCHKLCLSSKLLVRTVKFGALMGLERSRYCPPKRSYLTPKMVSTPELKGKVVDNFFV